MHCKINVVFLINRSGFPSLLKKSKALRFFSCSQTKASLTQLNKEPKSQLFSLLRFLPKDEADGLLRASLFSLLWIFCYCSSTSGKKKNCVSQFYTKSLDLCFFFTCVKIDIYIIITNNRKGGRVVNCTNFENWRGLAATGGSNPSLSDKYITYKE